MPGLKHLPWRAWFRGARVLTFAAALTVGMAAHAEFQNGSFESDYANWTIGHWKNPAAIPTFPPNKVADLGLTVDTTNSWNPGVLTDVVGNGADAKVNNALRFPLFGLKSARVNYGG